ncbi:hypothetical protein LJ725_06920 [Reyranella aquatilis]|uniref:CN hydrolase domain-containing protein n=1 Tax=Reyranella aquatilis TaxID=2035356 RepID=A0ABS8KSQ3_9HYPH|nr:hypothetical protein [Reyranella aquatilis]MCC8428688.1 hypothetical protein [Reyranella aquatilis]
MTYRKVQFIAYRIYTGAAVGADGMGTHFVGPRDPVSDLSVRLDLMTEAIHAAANSPDINRDPSVLKVFVAPEFYFRPRTGAYPDNGLLGAMGAAPTRGTIMGELSAKLHGPDWKDWLFVFGTAMVENRMAGEPRKPPGEIEMLNLALVQKGDRSLVVQKKRRGSEDWMDFPDVSPVAEDVKGFGGQWPSYFEGAFPLSYSEELNDRVLPGRGIDRGGIVRLDGITFGIEICADHGFERLRGIAMESGDVYAQIQIVPACGTWIVDARVATLKGGLIFGVDGAMKTLVASPAKSESGYHSELKMVTSENSRPPLAKGSTPTLEAFPVLATVRRIHSELAKVQEVFWLPPDNQPELAIYGSVPIPSEVTA